MVQIKSIDMHALRHVKWDGPALQIQIDPNPMLPYTIVGFECLVFAGDRIPETDDLFELARRCFNPFRNLSLAYPLIHPSSMDVAKAMGTGMPCSGCLLCENWSTLTPIHDEDCPGHRYMLDQLERDQACVQLRMVGYPEHL
jgi:hypothetical protein